MPYADPERYREYQERYQAEYKRSGRKRKVAQAYYAANREHLTAKNERRRLGMLPGLRRMLNEHKANGCVVCGERTLVALDLHHKTGTKKRFKPSYVHGKSAAAVRAELDKCIVLCANCHRKAHAGSIQVPGHDVRPVAEHKKVHSWFKPGSRYAEDTMFRDRAKRQSVERHRRHKEERLPLVLAAKSGGCCNCQEADSACLDLHHRDPTTKKFHIANRLYGGGALEEFAAEVAKCVAICANCHRKLHFG